MLTTYTMKAHDYLIVFGGPSVNFTTATHGTFILYPGEKVTMVPDNENHSVRMDVIDLMSEMGRHDAPNILLEYRQLRGYVPTSAALGDT